jgi:hypothetical protein
MVEMTPRGRWQARLSGALRHPYTRDLMVCLFFLLFAIWVAHGLWRAPATRVLALNDDDQTLYEWFLSYDTRALFGDFSLVTDRLNSPDGVNLLANTSVIALGILLAPITLAFGVPVTFALIITGNLGLTAVAWYFFYSRCLHAGRLAAGVGAGFCGFAPAMISQSNSHLHMTAQWLVPLMVWCVVRMARASDPLRPDNQAWVRRLITSAVALGALVVVQVFIGEEVLFLTAFTLVLVTIGYALASPARAARMLPRFAAGVVIAAGLAAAALAYPLSVQFSGPQSVPDGPFSAAYFSADLASFPAYSPMSLAGTAQNERLSTGASEYNTFLGWPLLLFVAGCIVWLRRLPITWAVVFASVIMTWLSLGPQIVINGERTTQRGPYIFLDGLPVVDGALPMRFAIALVPLIAALLVFAVDRMVAEPLGQGVRFAAFAALAVALLPLFPRPLPTMDRAPVPDFISQGHWRDCVQPGGVLVPVPLPTPPNPDPMRWAAAANAEFGLPEGFFIGPYGGGGSASMGTYSQPTSQILADTAMTGNLPAIGEFQREQAQRDIDFWNASCVALAHGPHEAELKATLDALFGPGRNIAGTWAWKVR